MKKHKIEIYNSVQELNKAYNDMRTNYTECANKIAKELDLEIQKEITRISVAQKILDELPELKEMEQAVYLERKDKIFPIKDSCEKLYLALYNRYSPLLDERDWKNLDLVIYELETRRADTLKEALQLVDRELQTNRIEQAIEMATKQISYVIKRGFAGMMEAMVKCSKQISLQLATLGYQLNSISGNLHNINGQLDGLDGRLSGINEALTTLTDATNLGNALRKKSDETSEQLIEDVYRIRRFGFDLY